MTGTEEKAAGTFPSVFDQAALEHCSVDAEFDRETEAKDI